MTSSPSSTFDHRKEILQQHFTAETIRFMMEKYSVLMSVYHREQPDFLRSSMESMFSQTVAPNDFVLVCDGPLTEALDLVIEELRRKYGTVLHVVRTDKNRGLAHALNTGLQECKHELVARMDSDDIAPPDRCQLQLQQFALDPELAIVGGAIDEFEGTVSNIISHKHMPEMHTDILRYARKRNPFNHPTVMFRRSAVLAAGGYPQITLHEDYGLWAELLMSGAQSRNLPQTLCCMRVDGGLYHRRGGVQYFITAAKFRLSLYHKGFYRLWDLICVLAALAVVCLVPASLRKVFYRKMLR